MSEHYLQPDDEGGDGSEAERCQMGVRTDFLAVQSADHVTGGTDPQDQDDFRDQLRRPWFQEVEPRRRENDDRNNRRGEDRDGIAKRVDSLRGRQSAIVANALADSLGKCVGDVCRQCRADHNRGAERFLRFRHRYECGEDKNVAVDVRGGPRRHTFLSQRRTVRRDRTVQQGSQVPLHVQSMADQTLGL